MLFGSLISAAGQSLPGSGNALFFNGSTTYVNCGTSNRNIRQQVTVAAWIKTSSSGYQWVVGKYLNSNFEEKGFHLYTVGGTAGFNGRNGSGQYMTSGQSTTRVDDGRWHQLTGVCDVSTWRIYVDGVLENTGVYASAGSDLTTSTSLVIGCYDVQGDQFFEGEIDEVRVWRIAMDVGEIRNRLCKRYDTAPQALVAYYRFDLSTGSLLPDDGTVPTSGQLMNFGSTAWHLSGAPLGDGSTYLYQPVLMAGSRLYLASASGDSAIVTNTGATSGGVHLYAVNAPPSIAAPGSATTYFGVFLAGAGAAARTYTLRLRPAAGPACRNAYTRLSNERPWTLPAQPATTATSLLIPTTLYRSEHILTESAGTTAAIVGDSVLCPNGRTQLQVLAPGSSGVLWNTGSTAAALPSVGPGTYTVTVNYSSGCARVLRRTVRAAAVPALAIAGDSTVCPGSGTTLTAEAGGATTYRWNTGATTAALSITQPGTYTVLVTYGPGCTISARRTVRLNAAAAPPVFSLGADTTLCEGDRLLLQGPPGPALRYLWSDNSTGRQLAVQAAGRYTLRVLTACGEQSASRTVAVRSCLVVPNILTANADSKNDLFAVQGLTGEGWELEVYSRWGRAVFRASNYRNDWGRDAAPGLYYVVLRRPATGYRYKGWLEVLR